MSRVRMLVVSVTVSDDGDCHPCAHLRTEIDGHWCRLFQERIPGEHYDTPYPCAACQAARVAAESLEKDKWGAAEEAARRR